jgi:hypothetical protein
MLKNTVLLLIAGFIFSISATAMGALTTPASGYDAKKAEETFTKYCTGCHDAQRSLRTRKGEANWQYAIERMAFQYKLLFGEPIPPQAQRIILEYLIQNAGKE